MNIGDIAKNLLLENTCLDCNHVREEIEIERIKSLPYILSYASSVIEIEKSENGIRRMIMAYIYDDKVYVSAEEYNTSAEYYIHLIYQRCEITNSPISKNSLCRYFTHIKGTNEIK